VTSVVPLPLAGIRVLDFSNLLPGPLASLLLAEAGAEVIKVERPDGGDEMRAYAPVFGDVSGNFALLNRGKASLCADLKDAGDRAHVLELVRSADVLIEQFRPGVMERLGLGYEQLERINPGLVYCSINGYGQTGMRALKAGHDLNYLAESGLLGLTRASDGAPVLPPVLAADIGGGAYPAVINIMLALKSRDGTGRGCHIDVAMTDNLFTFAYWGQAMGQAAGRWPRPGGELTSGGSPRYRIDRTGDGEYLAAAPIEERFWQIFCDVIGLAPAERHDASEPEAVIARVAARIASASADEWRRRFAGRDVCVTVVESLQSAFADPAFAGRGLFERVVSAQGARMPALPVPIPAALRHPAPEREAPALEPAARRRSWSARESAPSRPYDLSGMRILLTGASGGIGRATARLLAELGAELVLSDRVEAPDLLPELRAGGHHRFIACELGSRASIDALCADAGPVDAAVLGAGIFPRSGWDAPAWDEEFEQVMAINVRAPAHLARALLPGMKARGRGRIVVLGSIAARRAAATSIRRCPTPAPRGPCTRWCAGWRAVPRPRCWSTASRPARPTRRCSLAPTLRRCAPTHCHAWDGRRKSPGLSPFCVHRGRVSSAATSSTSTEAPACADPMRSGSARWCPHDRKEALATPNSLIFPISFCHSRDRWMP